MVLFRRVKGEDMNISNLLSGAIASKPESKRASANFGKMDISRMVRMGLNENPYGMSPKALEAMIDDAAKSNLYGDFQANGLKNALAAYYDMSYDHFLTAAGSSACIDLVGNTFLNKGDEVLMCPTFAAFLDMAQIHQAQPVIVPLKSDLTYDLDGLLAAITDKTKMIVICNPNNPTGTYVSGDSLRMFISKVPDHIVIIMDEAYIEFATAPDCESMMDLVRQGINKPLIVLRTFSKYYAMAGVRVGYAVAAPELIAEMKKCPCSCNINKMGQAAAIAAIHDQEYYQAIKAKVVEGREYLERELESLGCTVYHSQTNFIYFDAHVSPEWLQSEFIKKGIMISANQISRVSVGTMEENELFIGAMKMVLHKKEKAS